MTQCFSLRNKRIWIAGHRGMVGRALMRRLQGVPCDLLTSDIDLRVQASVQGWVSDNRPDVVILAAAKVGGIGANSAYPADFLYDNLMIESNVVHASFRAGVQKLLFLGSSCIYPKFAPQPIPESALLTGALEPTNEAYAIAKIAGIKLCQAYRRQHGRDFIAAMPCNLYGMGDTFDAEKSHVIPALIMKIHEAKIKRESGVALWGTGAPLREFLYVDDLADALVFLLEHYTGEEPVNVGSGQEISIAALASLIADIAGYGGRFIFDPQKPDGTPRKIMDSGKLFALGWQPATGLREGLKKTYEWYLEQEAIRHAA